MRDDADASTDAPGGPSATDRDPVTLVRSGDVWAERYREVAHEVAVALGDAMRSIDGDLLELHHVGSTAVPGLTTKPTLDLMGRLARWPMEARALERLERLGFHDRGEHGIPGRRYLTRGGHDVHLHLWAPEDHGLARHLAFRDLLLDDPEAREAYGDLKRGLVETHAGDRDAYVRGKDAWVRAATERALGRRVERSGFGPVRDLVRTVTASLQSPLPFGAWAIGGGWALDLAVGRARRPHDDLDVVLARSAAWAWIADLASTGVEVRITTGYGGEPWRPDRAPPGGSWRAQGRLGPLVAASPAEPGTWAGEPVAEPAFWDLAVEDRPADRWLLRTDPGVTRPIGRAVVRRSVPDVGEDVPVLAPEVALLCKARLSGRAPGARKDDADLRDALPLLDAEARAWLRAALQRAPAHPWAARLA